MTMSSLYLVLVVLWNPLLSLEVTGSGSGNEVPLRAIAWLPMGKVTPVYLPKDKSQRMYFSFVKGTSILSLTVVPCDAPIEWSLSASKPEVKHKNLHWTSKKSIPEVWWKHLRKEIKVYSYIGNGVETYTGPAYASTYMYVLKLQSREQDTTASVYLQAGGRSMDVFPELPPDPQVQIQGLGMTSVTLHWAPSPSVMGLPQDSPGYEYCVLVNRRHNYRGLCATLEAIKRDLRKAKEKQQPAELWPALKGQSWNGWDTLKFRKDSSVSVVKDHTELPCSCRSSATVCTVSELNPDTRYYFDVFLIDKLNGTSAAYTGVSAHTHEAARVVVAPLRDTELRWASLREPKLFRFRPRGWPRGTLLTLQSCGAQPVKVTVTSQGLNQVAHVGAQGLTQIRLQGKPSYQIRLESESIGAATSEALVKIQASSAYHFQAEPALPAVLKLKSFTKLRSCSSITIAWHGTVERNLFCVYRRKLIKGEQPTSDPCLGPESRPESERAQCRYYQELNPLKSVALATIGGLEPGTAYMFDVYMVRKFGISVKYQSKIVHTRKDC